MFLKKDGVEMANNVPVKLETPEDVPEAFTAEFMDNPGIVITISGDLVKKVSNIEIYFKEDTAE